jgi:hypothetical protein
MTPPRLVTLTAAAVAWMFPLAAQQLHYEGGLSMSSGSYIFTERTTSWVLSNGLAVDAGPFTIRATVPAYRQNTTLLTSSATGLLPTGGSSSGVVADSSAARKAGRGGGGGGGGSSQIVAAFPSLQESAALAVDPVAVPTSSVTGYQVTLGDPMVNISAVLTESGRTSLLASFGAKIPLNDTTSYGTGKWDVGGSLSLSHGITSNVLLGLDFSHWRFGDLPELDLRDGLMGSASIAYLGASGWGGSASFMAARSVVEGFADSYMVSVSVTRLAGVGALSMNFAAGLTEMTPDFTAGLSWRVGVL